MYFAGNKDNYMQFLKHHFLSTNFKRKDEQLMFEIFSAVEIKDDARGAFLYSLSLILFPIGTEQFGVHLKNEPHINEFDSRICKK